MTLRFCALASGSRGNALLVEHDDTLIMIDCGLPLATLAERLADVGRKPDEIDALFVTHEHGDHSRGIGPLRRRHEIPLWATAGTAQALDLVRDCGRLRSGQELRVGSIRVEPFTVPHDAREPCQFVFRAGGRRLGLLTDSGHTTALMHRTLRGCDALAVEFNHDRRMLENGSYPPSVKARIGSSYGHLSNEQAVDLIDEVAHPGLGWVMGLHLSESNNSPDRVRRAAGRVTSRAGFAFSLASQDVPSPWLEVR